MATRIVNKQPCGGTTNMPNFMSAFETALGNVGWSIEKVTDTTSIKDWNLTAPDTIDGEVIKLRLYAQSGSSWNIYTYAANGSTTLASKTGFCSTANYTDNMAAIVHSDAIILYFDGNHSNVAYSGIMGAGNLINWSESLGYAGADNLVVFFKLDSGGGMYTYKAKTLDTNGNEVTNNSVGMIYNSAYSYTNQSGANKEQTSDILVRFSAGAVGIGGKYRREYLSKSTRNSSDTIKEFEELTAGGTDYLLLRSDSYGMISEFENS